MYRSWQLFLVLAAGGCGDRDAAAGPIGVPTDDDLSVGKRLFNVHCARCHGIGGGGGEGPDLRHPVLPSAPDDRALAAVISNGIPGTGMGGTWILTEPEVQQIVSYVRSLGRTEVVVALSGDPGRGQAIFWGKGGCPTCHMVGGNGSSLGPELTAIGVRRGPAFLRDAVINPGDPDKSMARDAAGFVRHLLVHVVTREGRAVDGMRVNEDAFTIQLRYAGNRFHSFRKLDLETLDKKFGTSLMPSYAASLSSTEIDDLVAYLASLRGAR